MTPTTKIHALNDPIHNKTKAVGRLWRMASMMDHKWTDIQVGRQAQYSIERLESLDQYCKSTSKFRSICVCILTPLPVMIMTVLIESLPLRPPPDGWAANGIFWLRLSLAGFTLTIAGMVVLRRLVPGLPFTMAKLLIIATGSAAGYTGFSGSYGGCNRLSGSTSNVDGDDSEWHHHWCNARSRVWTNPICKNFSIILAFTKNHTHNALLTIYPLFKVLNDYVPEMYQSFTIILLPSGPLTLMIVIIVLDIRQTSLEFREVQINARLVKQLLYHRHKELITIILSIARDLKPYNIVRVPQYVFGPAYRTQYQMSENSY
ncbi:hypothetical protein PHMEG_00017362 [Phytophthora megakarya]|uniref:Uncharacterized protein n=1 Tax=Phytophthora megakarya TaxID=4795 RepID=A0A225VWY9_9STRA|nr:hypothetical protein PHMEG_00017362 [Phytophthora megakarya]